MTCVNTTKKHTHRSTMPLLMMECSVCAVMFCRSVGLVEQDIMYFNQYGCDGWGDYAGATGGSDCQHEAFGMIAVTYFSLFVLTSSFLLLNLFIGVITTAMHEAADDLHKEKKDAARLAIATRLRAKAQRKEGDDDNGGRDDASAAAYEDESGASGAAYGNPIADVLSEEEAE
jgi:hypothetical protein